MVTYGTKSEYNRPCCVAGCSGRYAGCGFCSQCAGKVAGHYASGREASEVIKAKSGDEVEITIRGRVSPSVNPTSVPHPDSGGTGRTYRYVRTSPETGSQDLHYLALDGPGVTTKVIPPEYNPGTIADADGNGDLFVLRCSSGAYYWWPIVQRHHRVMSLPPDVFWDTYPHAKVVFAP